MLIIKVKSTISAFSEMSTVKTVDKKCEASVHGDLSEGNVSIDEIAGTPQKFKKKVNIKKLNGKFINDRKSKH